MAVESVLPIASEGPAVESEVANAAPILDVAAPEPGPTLNYQPVEGLPPELQPDPGDILLAKAIWPWEDLGAQGVPEHWLYMSRKVQGTVAMLAVQTDKGPKLLKAQTDGTLLSQIALGSYVIPAYMLPNDPNSLQGEWQWNKAASLDASALVAASTNNVIAPGILRWWLKKVVISSNVGVTNKVQLLDEAAVFHSVILPANSPPYTYEFEDIGKQSLAVGNRLRLYTDNAGIFSVDTEFALTG